MSEVNTVYNKSSKQLLSLAYTLNNNKALEDRVVESLLVQRNVETIKKRKLKHKFRKHPESLTSESEISVQPIAHGFSESSLSGGYNRSCDISVTHSEHSTLGNNCVRYAKSPRQIALASSRSSSDTQSTVRFKKPEIWQEEIAGSIPLNKSHQHNSQSTNKLKQETAKSSMKLVNVASKVQVKTGPQIKNVDHKLRNYLQRITSCLEEIRLAMGKEIEPPDGAEEWERVKVRTSEFSARFSRNYLYSLGREIHKLQEMAKKSGSISNNTAKNIHQHMFNAHHIVLQALQMYRQHMATMLANTLAEKLQYVIEQTCILCNIHAKYLNLEQTGSSKRETLIGILTNRCNILLEKIQDTVEQRSQINNALFSPATRLSLMGYNVNFKKPTKPKSHKKAALETRLSMYSITSCMRSKDAFWKKTVESLAKDKLRYNHVQSRYKTAGFKHRPPTEKPTVIELPTKSKLFSKRSSCMLRNTPFTSPHNEDDILTMVEIQEAKENAANNVTISDPHKEQCNNVVNQDVKNVPRVTDCEQQSNNVKDIQLKALTPFIQELCQHVCIKDGEAMTQKQLEILLKGLLGMALDGKINNNNGDRETGSKKNGFALHGNAVNEIAHIILQNTQEKCPNLDLNENLSKNDEPHEEEMIPIETETEKVVNKDKAVENKKSLNMGIEHLGSSTILSEKNDGSAEIRSNNKNNVEEEPKANKVEFDEVSISKTKKTENGQLSKNKRRQTVTVTGAKNAQLICICDEDSIIESPETSEQIPAIKKNCDVKETPAACAQGEIRKNCRKNNSRQASNTNATTKTKANEVKYTARSPKTNIKISRLPKNFLKKLAMVPKTQALNVIQYKLQYSKFTKGNHMYRKSSKIQPWVIVDTISEYLLNDLLLSVAKEIQVDQLLENMYRSEFQ